MGLAGSGSPLLTVPAVLAQELLRDGGGATEGRRRSEMPKVTRGAPAPPRETEPGSQERAEGRGQSKASHHLLCWGKGRAGLGAAWIFLLFLCKHKVGLVQAPAPPPNSPSR